MGFLSIISSRMEEIVVGCKDGFDQTFNRGLFT